MSQVCVPHMATGITTAMCGMSATHLEVGNGTAVERGLLMQIFYKRVRTTPVKETAWFVLGILTRGSVFQTSHRGAKNGMTNNKRLPRQLIVLVKEEYQQQVHPEV